MAHSDDPVIYRTIVWTLSGVLTLTIAGAIYLAVRGVEIPQILVATVSGVIGLMGGLLAPSPISITTGNK